MNIRTRLLMLAAASLFFSQGAILSAEPNTLTPQESAAGWRLLFDGRTARGWHTYGTKGFPAKGWHVADGCWVNPKSNGRPNGSGGDLVTDGIFSDFEFRFEWRISPHGNSGVHYLFNEKAPKRKVSLYRGDEGNSPAGFEYQILDDGAYEAESRNGPNRLTASVYQLVTPMNKNLLPPGQFNEGRIVVKGNHVEHWLNGIKVLECDLGSPAMLEAIAKSKYKPLPGFGNKAPTALALQDHGDEVAFRNLKIRELH